MLHRRGNLVVTIDLYFALHGADVFGHFYWRIHDLKTDRANFSGGLPGIYKLVPIGFYVSAVIGLSLGVFFFLSERAYRSSEEDWAEKTALANSIQNEFIEKQTRLSREADEAGLMADWLEGSRPVQPIGITIARSMEGNASISELSLERNPQIPAHLFLTVKINGGGSQQIEGTLDALSAINYHAYSAQQVKGTEAVDFQATLIWNELD